MSQQFNFAPVSGGPSTRRRFVVGWLRINGAFGLGGLALAGILAIVGNVGLRALFVRHWLAALVTVVGSASLFLAANDLEDGKRRGAYAAGTIFALALATSFEGFLVGAVGLGAVISVWRELE